MNEQDQATILDQDDEAFAQRFLLQDYSSGATEFRARLRHQLIAQASERREVPMRPFSFTRHPALLIAAMIVVVLLATLLAWPSVPSAIAQGVTQLLQSMRIGPFTTVGQIAPNAPQGELLPSGRSVEELGPMWYVDTPMAGFGGNLPPNQDATVRRFSTAREAQAQTAFKILLPADLPTGYALREVALAPMKDQAFLFYDGPKGELVIVQRAVGKTEGPVVELSETEARQDVSVVAAGLMTDKPITLVTFGNRQAAWIDEDGGLWWEADGLSFAVGGPGLSLDQAMRIAASLK
jgi:hypothetical protein